MQASITTQDQDRKNLILLELAKNIPINSLDLAHNLKIPLEELHNLLRSLQANEYVEITPKSTDYWVVTAEGQKYYQEGSHSHHHHHHLLIISRFT